MAYKPEEREAAIEKLCHLIATGTEGIRQICAANPDLPSAACFMNWLKDDAEFVERYTRAREEQADGIAGEIIRIADEPLNGQGFVDANGEDVDVSDHAQALRLDLERRKQMIESRKWVAAKLKPGVYGEKMQLNADVTVNVPDAQLDARLAFLLGKAGIATASGREGAPEGTAQVLQHVPGNGTASS